MYGFNSRSLPEEEVKRRSGAKPAQPAAQPKADFYANSSGATRQGTMPPGAKDVAPVNPTSPKSPPAANFYTNPQGVTVDASKPIPSTSRDLVPVQGQKGGLPATTTQKPLGLPAPQQSPAPGAQGQADFFSNNRGQTARGFMPSSSRDIVTAPGQKGGLPAAIESPATNPKAGATASATTAASARDANLGAQIKNRARADSMAWQADQQRTNEAFRQAAKMTEVPTQNSGQGFRAGVSNAAGTVRNVANAAGKLGAVGLAVEPIMDGMEEDSTARYAKRFGLSEPTGDGSFGDIMHFAALRGLGAASDLGSAMTFGLADNLYRDKQETDTELLGTGVGAVLGGVGGNKGGSWVGGALDKGARLLSRGRYRDNAGERMFRGAGTAGGAVTGATLGRDAMAEYEEGGVGGGLDEPTEMPAGQPAPEDSGLDNVGTLQPMPEQMPILQGAGNNNVIREGNSFSGGVVGQGFTVNGRPFQENINTMPSEQNRKAIAALMERTPELGEGSSAGGFQPGRGNRPNFYIGRDTSTQERAERAALRAASNPYKGAQNGQLTANQVNALRGLANDIRTDETSRANNQADNLSRIQQTDMIQQGENQRTGARLSIDQSRLEGEQLERGFRVRQAQQVEGLRQAYQQAQDPEQRSAIAEQLRILNGDSGQGSEFQAQTVEIPVDPNDPMKGTMEVPFTFDRRTGQWQRADIGQAGAGRPQPSEANINALRMNKDNPEMIALFEARFGPGSAQQYLGDN